MTIWAMWRVHYSKIAQATRQFKTQMSTGEERIQLEQRFFCQMKTMNKRKMVRLSLRQIVARVTSLRKTFWTIQRRGEYHHTGQPCS